MNEALHALEGNYAIAMVDVDHFKKFNDTYGHEVGDQVLRFVASPRQRVGIGGQSFLYGGEEFSILFPGRSAVEVLANLEALRLVIAETRITLRDKAARVAKPRTPPRRKGTKQVSVTISIGGAERSERLSTPSEVIEAADQALSRAEEGGRNQVATAPSDPARSSPAGGSPRHCQLPINTVGAPMAIICGPHKELTRSPALAAGWPPMKTVDDPVKIGPPTHGCIPCTRGSIVISPTRAAGWPPISTVGAPGGKIVPPSLVRSPTLAAGSPANAGVVAVRARTNGTTVFFSFIAPPLS